MGVIFDSGLNLKACPQTLEQQTFKFELFIWSISLATFKIIKIHPLLLKKQKRQLNNKIIMVLKR